MQYVRFFNRIFKKKKKKKKKRKKKKKGVFIPLVVIKLEKTLMEYNKLLVVRFWLCCEVPIKNQIEKLRGYFPLMIINMSSHK
jgi:hypothetical protein